MTRILVVDDEPEVAELVQAVLKDEGYAADAVYSGQAALDHLQQTVYDLVVCDVRMPTSTGRRSSAPSRSWCPRGQSCSS
jgi:two-component system response regulator HydG